MKKTVRSAGWRKRLDSLLQKVFEFPTLRPGQGEVIDHVMAGHDVLAVMPTGAGKSLCYQLPALVLDGRTVIVSPLISLMKDQCDKLRAKGIAAIQLNSSLSADAEHEADQALDDPSVKLVFVTPERIGRDADLVKRLRAQTVSLVVVDEAHCISQWGHDFRPAYLQLGAAIRALGDPAVLALTATATTSVADDIEQQLGVGKLARINTGVYRSNLHYRVETIGREADKIDRALALVSATPGSGIVYASTIKGAEAVHGALAAAGESVTLYHARLGLAVRKSNQEAFMSGAARIVVATNAFGLGIDKVDTRFVVHFQVPGGLDAYYQESGRAGRDGEPAVCTLLYFQRDRSVQQFFLVGRYPTLVEVEAVYNKLAEPAPGAGSWDVAALHEATGIASTKLQVALKLLQSNGALTLNRRREPTLLPRAMSAEDIGHMVATYGEKAEHDREMLERMVFYAQSGLCRWKILLEHFGQTTGIDRCGSCDNCVATFRLARELDERRADEASDAPVQIAAPVRAEKKSSRRSQPPSTDARFKPGDSVKVPRYGMGEVLSSNDQTVDISFPDGRQRSFVSAYVHVASS